MAGNKKPRKKHVRRPVGAPVTGLRDQFGLIMQAANTAAKLGYFDEHQFDRLAEVFNCIRGAMALVPPHDPGIVRVLDGAMRVLIEVGKRAGSSGSWQVRDGERDTLLTGIDKIEEHLPKMNVLTLYQAIKINEARSLTNE